VTEPLASAGSGRRGCRGSDGVDRWERERGSATVWVLVAAAVICAFAGVGVSIGLVAAADQRARTVADLSALAAAAALVRAEGDPCVRAREIAQANRAVVSRCAVDGSSMRIWVAVGLPAALRALDGRAATARARAGPVGTP
jgi:secretion/DNA translocation related TadE-like protein